MLRLSDLFFRTLREDPADAEGDSHRLLVRAGYIRRLAPGVYQLLPLGQRLFDNVARIVREELDAIGAQQLTLPALVPRSVFDASGRWEDYGGTLFRLQDRKGGDYLLAPTHEELFTLLVKDIATSYKDLPVSLYQIQTKYRDELRPRAGVIRGREFVMADSYSFDLDDAGLEASYQAHRRAFSAMFDRMGLRYHIVSAISGAMGGSASEEFLAPADGGEDTFARCASCGFAANVEAVAAVAPPAVDPPPDATPVELATPKVTAIDQLVEHLHDVHGMDVDAGGTLKSVVVKVDGQPVLVAVPGDRDVHLGKLEAVLGAEPEAFEDADFAASKELKKGYLSPVGMADAGVRVITDVRVAPGSTWVAGANAWNAHLAGVVAGTTWALDEVADVATALDGDPCPTCGRPLALERGIEVGHIFQLGTKYTEAFDLAVPGPDGELVRVTMGSYGVGVTRAIGVIAEQTADEQGLCWPASVAPAEVLVVPVPGKGDDTQATVGAALAADLEAAGLTVMLDDRPDVRPGVRFKDAELLGIPTAVVVGRRAAEGFVELRNRAAGTSEDVELATVVARLTA